MKETIDGVPVTEKMIEGWLAEAEAGFDVEVWKKRRRARAGDSKEAETNQRS